MQYKYILLTLFLILNFAVLSQNNFIINFNEYADLEPSCNAFKYEDTTNINIKASHGSPQIKVLYEVDYYNAYFKSTNIDKEKSEGIFFKYNFNCAHSYDIKIYIGSTTSSHENTFEIYAANGLVERDDKCLEGTIPKITNKQKILEVINNQVYGSPTFIELKEYIPDNNYNYLWMLSRSISGTSEYYIQSIEIWDNGVWDTEKPDAPNMEVRIEKTPMPYIYDIYYSWETPNDNSCIKEYHLNGNYIPGNQTGEFEFGKFLIPCKEYRFSILAVDAADNFSEVTYVNVFAPPNEPDFLVLDEDFTNKDEVLKEATYSIKLKPGFKYIANETNDYFIARIAQCPLEAKKNDLQNNIDTLESEEKTQTSNPQINKFSNHQIQIYPNPTSGVFNIYISDNSNNTISIYDITGKIIFDKKECENNIEIDLSPYSQGVYIIKIINDTGISFAKVIKE